MTQSYNILSICSEDPLRGKIRCQLQRHFGRTTALNALGQVSASLLEHPFLIHRSDRDWNSSTHGYTIGEPSVFLKPYVQWRTLVRAVISNCLFMLACYFHEHPKTEIEPEYNAFPNEIYGVEREELFTPETICISSER